PEEHIRHGSCGDLDARAERPARATYPRPMFRPTLPIETERLRLRAWTMGDLDAFADLYGDPDVVRYLYDEPLSREAAGVRLGEYRDHLPEPDRWMNLAV